MSLLSIKQEYMPSKQDMLTAFLVIRLAELPFEKRAELARKIFSNNHRTPKVLQLAEPAKGVKLSFALPTDQFLHISEQQRLIETTYPVAICDKCGKTYYNEAFSSNILEGCSSCSKGIQHHPYYFDANFPYNLKPLVQSLTQEARQIFWKTVLERNIDYVIAKEKAARK